MLSLNTGESIRDLWSDIPGDKRYAMWDTNEIALPERESLVVLDFINALKNTTKQKSPSISDNRVNDIEVSLGFQMFVIAEILPEQHRVPA